MLTMFGGCAGAAGIRILPGPNILVSKGEHTPHVEPIVAAYPADSNLMLGAAIVVTEADNGSGCRTYASTDGGNSWLSASVPEQVQFPGYDPQVAFGLHGTAYFAALTRHSDAQASGIYFYRSEDAGKSWGKGVFIGSGDHEQIAVDATRGKYAGRVYLASLVDKGGYSVQLVRSDNDGRSFEAPVHVADQSPLGVNVLNLQLFSDGGLFVPFISFETDSKKRITARKQTFSFVTSEDGGVTFSKPTRIDDEILPEPAKLAERYKSGSPAQLTFPVFAIDSHETRYRDRVYVVWSDNRRGTLRLSFSYSADRGRHWTEPKFLSPDGPGGSEQYQPAITVNKDGVVGIEWFDTRNDWTGKAFDVYFAASADGGETFSPATKISSASSFPASAGNLKPIALPSKGEDTLSIQFLSAFNRWPMGGDYIGLTSDTLGRFHPFWADSRTGTYEVYTSSVNVVAEKATSASKPTTGEANVSSRVELVFDPIQYHRESGEMWIPVRLRNISQQAIDAPIYVQVKGVVTPSRELQSLEAVPEILNADNGKPGLGAVFIYSKALDGTLPQKSVTEAVTWRLKFPHSENTAFYLEVEVRAGVPAPN